jgi:hypothetical protein
MYNSCIFPGLHSSALDLITAAPMGFQGFDDLSTNQTALVSTMTLATYMFHHVCLNARLSPPRLTTKIFRTILKQNFVHNYEVIC